MKNGIMNRISNPGIRSGIVFLTDVKSGRLMGGTMMTATRLSQA